MGKYPYFPKVNSTWNKEQTFDGITIKEVTTPSTNPPANYMKLYFKADGKLYKLNSSGAETVSNSTVSAITQALLDAKANINNPSFTGIVTIPNIANLETAVVANTAKISLDDNSVTLAKLAHGTADKYLGFDGSGVPAELTVSGGVPAGCILMWSGAIIAIPATWYLCDGTNGTPNLSNKFIRSGSSVGSTGGADTVSLTEAQLASHTHTQSAHTHTQDAHGHTQDAHGHGGSTNTTGAHTHTFTTRSNTYVGTYPAGSINGETVGTITTSSNGSHSHTVTVTDTTATNQATTAVNQSTTATNSNTTATNANTGSGSAHENMPSYYTLAYIMKA